MGSDGHWAGEVDYLNFDLDIGQGSGRKYPMTARSPTGGEVHAEMRFPFVKGVLESKLKDIELVLYTSGGTRRRINSPEEQTVQDFGRALFDALISSEVRSCYDVACARQSGRARDCASGFTSTPRNWHHSRGSS